jgi:hypothetical protein
MLAIHNQNSPFTKVLEVTSDCSISLYIATFGGKATFIALDNN